MSKVEDLDLRDRARLTAGRDMWTTAAIPEAGIRSAKMADGPIGVASGRVDERDVSVLTPCPTALGASFDADLVARVGALVADEARRLGVDMLLAPNLNLQRSPLVGRGFEMFGEDAFLAGVLGAAWIRGAQGQGVGCVAKHLVCNDSETARDTMNSVVDEATLREVYLRPFEMAAEAGCVGMLAAYNRLNGAYCCESRELLSRIIKEDWAYSGFLVSDWFGTRGTLGSAGAGLDLEMPGPERFLGSRFADAVLGGEVPKSRLDDAARRVAAGVAAVDQLPRGAPASPEARARTLTHAAAAGFVLLKNEGPQLPLAPGRTRRIALIGPNAVQPCLQGGTFAKVAPRPDAVNPLDAIGARYAAETEILFAPGVDPSPRLPPMPVTPARDLGDGCVRGMTVEIFPDHQMAGAPVIAETRNTNSLTWFAKMPGLDVLDQPGAVRASGMLTPDRDGEHLFFVGGTGDVRLTVDGVERYAGRLNLPAGDVMGVLKAGDADTVAVLLKAGVPVRVVVELRYTPARAQGLWYGVRGPLNADQMLAEAVASAKAAEAVVLMLGETADAGVESKDRQGVRLPDEQLALLDAVTAVNSNVTVVANVAHAFEAEWVDRVQALMVTWYPGECYGEALAAVLAGDLEPGGRLPVTIARRDEDYPAFSTLPDANGDLLYGEGRDVGYRGLAARKVEPRFAFGAGRGYADLSIEDVTLRADGNGWTVRASIGNRSERVGKEVVQVYVAAPGDAAARLEGFASAQVAPGGVEIVEIRLTARNFVTWDDGWVVRPGRHRVMVGRSSDEAIFEAEVAPADVR